MESFSSFFGSQSASRNGWSFEALKNFNQISPVVQNHLKQVYFTLCCALMASALGAYLHILWNIGGILTLFGVIGSMLWMLATPPYQEQKRLGLLIACCLLQGATIGPLVQLAVNVDVSLLVTAFVATSLVFACFSGAALVARRREYLYLGGLVSSGFSILMWLHLASSIFGTSALTFKAELYLGLVVFMGYIIVDTQEIIEKAHLGDMDYLKHALTLFTDFVAVFVRILIILMDNKTEREEKEKKKRRKD